MQPPLNTHCEALTKMYLQAAACNQYYEGLKATFSPGEATIILPVNPKYFHAAHAMHGSVYFKLLDDAAFFAVNTLVEDVFVLTTNFNLNLIRPVTTGVLTAKGQIEFQSRNLFIARAELFNDKGKKVAFGTGHFSKSKIKLDASVGYFSERE